LSKAGSERIFHLNQEPRRKPNPQMTMSATISLRKPHAPSVDLLDVMSGAGRVLARFVAALQPARETVPAYARRDAGLAAAQAYGLDWTNAEFRRLPL
jgi:hypothetical protein